MTLITKGIKTKVFLVLIIILFIFDWMTLITKGIKTLLFLKFNAE